MQQQLIFVVDDNDTNLVIAKKALSDEYRIMTMPSAEKMFTFLNKMKPDLILLDIEMPEKDGFDALKQLKDNPENKNIPVIFLTSGGTPANVSKSAELGACDFIVKPFETTKLKEKVAKYILKK